jgi:dihydroflavonol-4-reductase
MTMDTKIWLTGASGLLGAHILAQGLARGLRIEPIARSVSPRSFLYQAADKFTVHALDLVKDSLVGLISKGDRVVNCAGLASSRPEDAAAMSAANVVATQNLWRAAFGKVSVFAHISSVATLSGPGSAEISTEKDQGCSRESIYAKTKTEADLWLAEQARLPGAPRLVIIHPCYMLGRWDARPSSGIIFPVLRMKKLKYYENGLKNFVAVGDVARGVLSALERPVSGHFILGGANHRVVDFLEITARVLGMDLGLTEITGSGTTVLNPAETGFIREFCADAAASSNRAENELGYLATQGLESMIRETVEYFREFRMLPGEKRPG